MQDHPYIYVDLLFADLKLTIAKLMSLPNFLAMLLYGISCLYYNNSYTVLPELPTADDRGRVPDPLENPPDSAEVGRDIYRAAATGRKVLPSGK